MTPRAYKALHGRGVKDFVTTVLKPHYSSLATGCKGSKTARSYVRSVLKENCFLCDYCGRISRQGTSSFTARNEVLGVIIIKLVPLLVPSSFPA
jgi:hypothetical protein